MARQDKTIAMRLRMQGKTYSEIQKQMSGIPKSTLSAWLSSLVISDEARSTIAERTRTRSFEGLLKRNKRQTLLAVRRKKEIQNKAKSQIGGLTKQNVLLIGAALYWAEGYKRPKVKNGRELTNHPVFLTNADPALLNMLIRFLVELCGVDRNKIKMNVRHTMMNHEHHC